MVPWEIIFYLLQDGHKRLAYILTQPLRRQACYSTATFSQLTYSPPQGCLGSKTKLALRPPRIQRSFDWVAVKELKSNYHSSETIAFTIQPRIWPFKLEVP